MKPSIWEVEEQSVFGLPVFILIKDGNTFTKNSNKKLVTCAWNKRGWAQRKANQLNEKEYPYKTLKKLGIEVKYDEVNCMEYIDIDELDDILFDKGEEYTDKFNKTFGCQTMSIHGPYPSDVEAVLCKLETGKLTGSQLHWD